MSVYLVQWAWCASRGLTTRRLGKADPRRGRGERLARSWRSLAVLTQLGFQIVDAVFLLLYRAHLILVDAGHPVVLPIKAVVLRDGCAYGALELMLLDTVLGFKGKHTTAMSFLKFHHLTGLDLVLVTREDATKEVNVVLLNEEDNDSHDIESADERDFAVCDQIGLSSM